MNERFPGYNVLDRRHTESWNEKTRQVVDRRIAVHVGPRFFNEAEWETLSAVCERILPQPADRPRIPLAAYVDEKLLNGVGDGYRYLPLPDEREAWRRGLAALDKAAVDRSGGRFHTLPPTEQDNLLQKMEAGELREGAFADFPSNLFFEKRVVFDITAAYYAHPTAWTEIGFGGPASPRGYVRMEIGDRDPWEPAEAHDDPGKTRRENKRVL